MQAAVIRWDIHPPLLTMESLDGAYAVFCLLELTMHFTFLQHKCLAPIASSREGEKSS